ncbi:MAG: tRNA (N(6)-L-threonylcarbamoyladenosine(37)-C(2))-methylthiotransferase MtaB [Bacilli bacterium]
MKAAIYTLGCKVNAYESEYIINQLISKGYEIVPFNTLADIYIINTCTVTNISDSKSMKAINKAINKKNNAIIVVIGCLVQSKFNSLKENRDIDILIGNKDKSKVVDYVEQYIKAKERIIKIYDLKNLPFENMDIDCFYDRTRAFVKIQDGCNNYCSYCIIPYVKGNIRSKSPHDVINEINNLVNNGYLEIVLTGIHTGSYGRDLNNYSLAKLLKEIVKIKNLKRLRISSIEITEIDDEILNLIKEHKVIVNHLHIPLQSGCNKILKAMNRKYDVEYYNDVINKIRAIRPNIAITTDVIVGFPGETDEDFNDTYNFIKKIKFSKLHVFPYSKRDNTVAAKLDNQVDEKIKKSRVNKLIQLSKRLEKEYMNKFISKEIKVLFETDKDGYYIGHTSNYLEVKVASNKDLKGKIVNVKILQMLYPYLIAEIIEK